MPEVTEIHQDEHVLERDRKTLARINGLLQSDPFYKQFRDDPRNDPPVRTDSQALKESKQTRLVRNYMHFIVRMAGLFRKDVESQVIENISLKSLPESYIRAERTRREALNQDFDEHEELARVLGDKRERAKEWLERLTVPDHYTPAFQYLIWRSIIRESDTKTVNPLPQFHEMSMGMMEELILAHDRAGEGQALRAIENVFKDPFFAEKANDSAWKSHITALVQKNSITELYSELSKLVTDIEEIKGKMKGRWVVYTKDGIASEKGRLIQKGDGARMLRDASARTPWCLGRYATAQSYLSRGPLHVFLAETPKGERPAFGIALDHQGVAYEARGSDDSQQLASQFVAFADERLAKTKGGEKYRQRLDDAKDLAAAARFLENPKHADYDSLPQALKDECGEHLQIIYEMERTLTGFGYGENTYVKKLRKDRDPKKDAKIIFDNKVAENFQEITKDTKAYIGPLSKEVWKKIGNIEHIYTTFPDGKITPRTIELEATQPSDIKQELEGMKVYASDTAKYIVDNIPEDELGEHGSVETVSVRVADLFTKDELKKLGSRLPTTRDIFDERRLKRLGLERCPATVAPKLLTDHAGTFSPGYWEYVATKEILDRSGRPCVFRVARGGRVTLGLDAGPWAHPVDEWGLGARVVFRFRK